MNIYFKFDNCDNIFKSKNAKNNIKKYIKKIIGENKERKIIVDILNVNIDNIKKKIIDKNLNINYNINIDNNIINITIIYKKFSDKDLNKERLKKKLKNLNNKKNYLHNKKIETKKFNLEKDILKEDSRVTTDMITKYYNVKYDMPESSLIPTPINILNDLDKFKQEFNLYLKIIDQSKDELRKYILYKNSYSSYLSHMTGIKIMIPYDLEHKYQNNNLKIENE